MRLRILHTLLVLLFCATAKTVNAADLGDWGVLDGDQGILMKPVLGCRAPDDLMLINNTAESNRGPLAQAAARRGRCTKLSAYSVFVFLDENSDAIEIRTSKHGRLWVAKKIRVPGLSDLRLAGDLGPEPEEDAEARYTDDERREIESAISARKTVPGFAGSAKIGGRSHVPGVRNGRASMDEDSDDTRTKSCRCVNGRYIKTNQSCDAACDVHNSHGESGASEDGYCYFHGELMDCEQAGKLKFEERARRY